MTSSVELSNDELAILATAGMEPREGALGLYWLRDGDGDPVVVPEEERKPLPEELQKKAEKMRDELATALKEKGTEGLPQERGRPDLMGAQLQGADLGGAKLEKANLYGAQLQKADLTTAQLQEADLTKAQLQKANLEQANLTGANLVDANLAGAAFPSADLTKADLKGAIERMPGAHIRNHGQHARHFLLPFPPPPLPPPPPLCRLPVQEATR